MFTIVMRLLITVITHQLSYSGHNFSLVNAVLYTHHSDKCMLCIMVLIQQQNSSTL